VRFDGLHRGRPLLAAGVAEARLELAVGQRCREGVERDAGGRGVHVLAT